MIGVDNIECGGLNQGDFKKIAKQLRIKLEKERDQALEANFDDLHLGV